MKKLLILILAIIALSCLFAQEGELKPVGAWSSFMGNTIACSNYLGYDYSSAWIYGVTGYAFLLNMHSTVCPSSPTAFDNGILKRNAMYLGLEFDTIDFAKNDPELASRQLNALQRVETALAEGKPAFGWELGIPEYYLIASTDSTGYFYFDFDGSLKHCPYQKIATSEIGMAEFNLLSRAAVRPDALSQVRNAISFTAFLEENSSSLALPGYSMGNKGYDAWINALAQDKANKFGMAYNAHVWTEARLYAVMFLNEIPGKLGSDYNYSALKKAAKQYKKAAAALTSVCALYPFPPRDEVITPAQKNKSVKLLKQAQQAELKGMTYLKQFGKEIGN